MKRLFFLPALFALAATAIFFVHGSQALAFNNNNLIDDGIFNNASSMNAAGIDNWLNANFPSSCISTNHGFSAPDVTGYSPSNSFSYGGDVSAGTIIYHAAQVYGLNPQVILATLQKEQSLVSGSSGCGVLSYAAAMGYGCPDGGTAYNYSGQELYSINGTAVTSVNGTCVNSAHTVGFSRQVIVATWQLKFDEQRSEGNVGWDVQRTNYPNAGNTWDNSDDPQTCYSHKMTQGFFQVCPGGPSATFDGLYSIDGTTVHMDNGATAALYNYTPHFAGNQNFDSIFLSWFGNIYDVYSWAVASQYAYTDASKSTPIGSTNIGPGQRIYVGFTARNTGDTTWTNSGSSPMHAATTSPQDRNSPFCDNSWLSCNRPANMIEASVAPGQTGTFEFWYDAPAQAGTYNEHFSLVIEGFRWLNDPGLYFHTVAQPAIYSWSIAGQDSYTDSSKSSFIDSSHMIIGQRIYLVIKAKNTGNVSWANSGSNPAHLGTNSPADRNSTFCDNSWLSCNRPANMTEASVAPGQTGTFEFWYKASQTGTFFEAFKPVIEGGGWTNDTGLYYYTEVHFDTSGTSPTLNNAQSLSSGQSLVSSDGRYKLAMQGDGNLVMYSFNNRPLWASNTAGKPVVRATMQGDGNLVLYDASNKPYWASNTAGKGSSTLAMQSDGNLVIYDSNNHPTWASNTVGRL